MKTRLFITALILAIAIASCKKEDAPVTVIPDPVDTWQYNGTTLKAEYSDIITKKGLTLIFHPSPSSGLGQSLTFIFTARPLAEGSYKPAPDTVTSSAVRVHLETGTDGYTSTTNDTAQVRATIVGGKLNLTGFNVRVQRDAAPGEVMPLSFDVREF